MINPSKHRPNPVLSLWAFTLVAFGVPWLCWTILAIGWVDGASNAGRALYLSGAACSIGGLIAAGVEGGWASIKRILAQSIRVRAGLAWWLFALLLAPLWHLAAVASYAAIYGGPFVLDVTALAALLSLGTLYLFIPGPLAEELGWRGYLLPRLVERHGAVTAVVIVGALWTVWHLPLFYDQVLSSPTWALHYAAFVMCLSVLIGTVYLHTQSLLLAIIMHWSVNTAQILSRSIFPEAAHGDDAFNLVRIGLLILAAVAVTPLLLRFRARRA